MLPHGSGSPGPPWQSPMRAGGSRGFRGGDQVRGKEGGREFGVGVK